MYKIFKSLNINHEVEKMFNLYFNKMIKHSSAVAKSAMVSSACDKNNNTISMHMGYSMCFFIISSLVAVIINLVVINEIICIAIIIAVIILSVNNKLNSLKSLNKHMG